MSYQLEYKVDADLYLKAASVPLGGPQPRWRRYFTAGIRGFVIAIVFLTVDYFVFLGDALQPLIFGALIGVAYFELMLWRHRRRFQQIYAARSEGGEHRSMTIDETGMSVKSPNMSSQISWPCVCELHRINGATIIELKIDRFIVPDDALPDGVDAHTFIADLSDWRAG